LAAHSAGYPFRARWSAEYGIAPEALKKCLDVYCRRRLQGPGEGSTPSKAATELAGSILQLMKVGAGADLIDELRGILAEREGQSGP